MFKHQAVTFLASHSPIVLLFKGRFTLLHTGPPVAFLKDIFRYLKCPQIDVEMFLKEWFLLNRNCLRRQPVCLQLIITPFCLDHEFCSWQEAQSMEDMRHALCGSVGGLVIPRRDPHSGLRCWEGWQGWWFWPEVWCFLSQDGWIDVFFWVECVSDNSSVVSPPLLTLLSCWANL